jgi:hypothetical protein
MNNLALTSTSKKLYSIGYGLRNSLQDGKFTPDSQVIFLYLKFIPTNPVMDLLRSSVMVEGGTRITNIVRCSCTVSNTLNRLFRRGIIRKLYKSIKMIKLQPLAFCECFTSFKGNLNYLNKLSLNSSPVNLQPMEVMA